MFDEAFGIVGVSMDFWPSGELLWMAWRMVLAPATKEALSAAMWAGRWDSRASIPPKSSVRVEEVAKLEWVSPRAVPRHWWFNWC